MLLILTHRAFNSRKYITDVKTDIYSMRFLLLLFFSNPHKSTLGLSQCLNLSCLINPTVKVSLAMLTVLLLMHWVPFSASGSFCLLLYPIFTACHHNLTFSHEPLCYFYSHGSWLQPLLRPCPFSQLPNHSFVFVFFSHSLIIHS